MKYDSFCIIQNGYAIFGIGHSEEEAIQDATFWVECDEKDLKDLPSYPAANMGELTILPCTDELFRFIQDGGDPEEFDIIKDSNGNYYADHSPLVDKDIEEEERD